jgi:hypothetical protein
MQSGIKILLTVVVFIIGFGIILLLQAASGRKTIGPIGIFIIFPCMIAAWKAIWNYGKNKKDNNTQPEEDKHILKKD